MRHSPGAEELFLALENTGLGHVVDGSSRARRLFKKAVQQGRSEGRGETYAVPSMEPLSDARTMLTGFFNSLLGCFGRLPTKSDIQ